MYLSVSVRRTELCLQHVQLNDQLYAASFVGLELLRGKFSYWTRARAMHDSV